MAYTLEAPSKRVRPVLALLAAELCGGSAARAMPAAAAMELVHASSLILDDLPSMDDAALRRGRPANHVAFGEAIAILAAFGLLNLRTAPSRAATTRRSPRGLAALVSDAVGTARPDRRPGARSARDRPGHQLRYCSSAFIAEDRRAVRRGRGRAAR